MEGPRARTIEVPVPHVNSGATGGYKRVTVEAARKVVEKYGSTDGGVRLEGSAGLNRVRSWRFNPALNALVLNEEAVYFFPVSPSKVASLFLAIAEKDEIGVSLASPRISFGALPSNSEVANDLFLVDNFLGDIVFARTDGWLMGYLLAGSYVPKKADERGADLTVSFQFGDFEATLTDKEVQFARPRLDVGLTWISRTKAKDGGFLADEVAQAKGEFPKAYEENADHVGRNIEYYRRERIIDLAFSYGEVAALARSLKASGLDLREIAAAVQSSTGGQALVSARGRYHVVDVDEDDSDGGLVVREAPDPESEPVGVIPWDGRNIIALGEQQETEGQLWRKVHFEEDGLTGWVNDRFLQRSSNEDAMCRPSSVEQPVLGIRW
jgi:hypothetical protein